jgi:hypothetical protein
VTGRHAVAGALVVAALAAGGYAVANRQRPTPQTVARIAPGALAVPQPSLAQLCAAGYTATIRPSQAYTTGLKRRQMKTYNLPGSVADYEEDHQVPLELGGAPMDERNLWPEPWPDAHKKDLQENAWHRSICAGRATLPRAQEVFLTDQWSRVTAP